MSDDATTRGARVWGQRGMTPDTLTVEQVEAWYDEAPAGTALHRACEGLLALWDDGPEGVGGQDAARWRQWCSEAAEAVLEAARGGRAA